MTEKFNKFLDIPTTQRKGIFVLSIIILILIIAPTIYKSFFAKPKEYNFEPFRKEVESFVLKSQNLANKNENKIDNFNFDQPNKSIARNTIKPFEFNPNNLPAEEWIRMGFSQHQVKSIKNYESKGGKFFTKNDVKKMFAISDIEYQIIEPYILLPESSDSNNNLKKKKEEKIIEIIELNSADTTLLKTLPGIGSYWARQIIWYRNKLGGFINKSQLLEIQNFDNDRFSNIENYIDINPYIVKKININNCNLEQLRNHPYITNNVAISIVNIRTQHGKYSAIDGIMKSELIDEAIFKKLQAYLTVD